MFEIVIISASRFSRQHQKRWLPDFSSLKKALLISNFV